MIEQRDLFETQLHQMLGLSDEEIRDELGSAGLDPIEESEALRLVIALAVRRQESLPTFDRQLAALLSRRFALLD